MILLLGSTPRRVETHIHSVKIIIAIINQRFSIGINEDLLNLYSKSGNQKSEIPQYKSKPSSLEIALKLRKMPSLKLNYSSSAFSRALLHNKKVRTRYLGTKHPKFLTHPVLAAGKAWVGSTFWPTPKSTLCQPTNIPTNQKVLRVFGKHRLERSLVQFWARA